MKKWVPNPNTIPYLGLGLSKSVSGEGLEPSGLREVDVYVKDIIEALR